MPRILVIADDLTGAAEIGGIATRYGLSVQLLRTPAPPPVDCDVVVYDTDSRLLPAGDAATKVDTVATAAKAGAFDLIYKKTDSVLRGEPFAEINIVARRFGRSDVLFLPQNPSRDRCIVNGQYTVGGVQLSKTAFANDPSHPATTSVAIVLLRAPTGANVRCAGPESSASSGWILAAAGTLHDVAQWAERLDPDRQLAAGGADFFDAIVQRSRRTKPKADRPVIERPLLYVSGTTSTANADFRIELGSTGQLVPMPTAVFEKGESAGVLSWVRDVVRVLRSSGVAMVAVGGQPDDLSAPPEQIGRSLAAVAARAAQLGQVATLACEGGATAAAVCDYVGWKRFAVEAEVKTGIVALRVFPRGARVIVKPGSYQWPRL